MFVRNYKVKGEDVNDFMVMQNYAYLSYSSRMIESYLMENGFPKMKLNSLKIGWQKSNDRLQNKKQLMFTQSFSVRLNFDSHFDGSSIKTYIDFYNERGELTTTLTTDLSWINYESWERIVTPHNMIHLFTTKSSYKKAV